MAALTATNMQGSGSRAVTINTLTASDTFIYQRGAVMVLKNATVSPVTPNIDGAGGTTVPVAGIGSVSVANGYTLPSVAAGATVAIPLDSINAYLRGTITMTGATDCEVAILNF